MISAIILTKNEENNIVDCLESVNFCDERIVIDGNSTDRTKEVAKSVGAIVYTHDLKGNFSAARNYGLEKARGDWVLFVDADERVSQDLRNEIIYKTTRSNKIAGYFIKRFDFMKGKMLKYGETANIELLRLARKESGVWEGLVHEQWNVRGKTEVLDSPLLHYPHPTIDEFLKEINFYTDLRAKELFEKRVKVSWYDLIVYPKAKFLQNYILRKGFMDGTEGMVMALLMSFHSFLVRGKLWQLWDQNKSSH